MNSFFSVKKDDLERLSASGAVDRFRELLWSEATALGIGKHLINVSTAITVSDGGVDAEIRDVPANSRQGIIKNGLTCYQIKTGPYSLRVADNIKKILYVPKSKGTELEPRVKACLDQDGTLIIVLFGWDSPETEHNEFQNRFRKELTKVDPKYAGAKIEIWQPNQLMGFFNTYPSLALKVRGVENALVQSHKSWSLNDDMKVSFERGDEQNKFIAELRAGLRQDNEVVHIHVMGEPGIGKTRCVLEATDDSDLAPLVIYCSDAEKFQGSNLMNELLMEDNHFAAILVLDECDNESRYSIWNRLKRRGSRIKLVSIYSENSLESGDTKPLFTPLLSRNLISNIIQTYGIVEDQANRWSELCDGSPRVAHVIGWNLNRNPEDLLRPLDTIDIWERFIVGGDDRNSLSVRQRRLVLQYIALFKRFGYGRPVLAEGIAILEIIKRDTLQIDKVIFDEVIETLKSRKILQGNDTLYITPKALHIKLWIDWWKFHGRTFQFDNFIGNLSSTPKLLEWFYEMFKYAAQSDAATTIVKELLGENGPFQNDAYLQTELGARFFLALTEAEPGAALSYLKSTIGNWNKEKLLAFTTGRREVVWALERIAMWKEYFIDATQLLLALGEAENESWANNASGIFVELFSLGTDALAPTQASPEERLPILKEALQSSVKEHRLLAMRACNKALESQHFFRDVDAEYQGLRRVPNLWMPKTYGELYDAYRQVWHLLYDQLERVSEDERQIIIDILLQRAQGLGRYPALADMVINTVDKLVHRPDTDKKKILADIVRILHYDRKQLPEQIRQRWEQLKNSLVGTDFSSRMKRYVGMDLLEDSFDEQGNHGDQIQPQIVELAQQVIDNPELLSSELHWLVTNEAQNGYRFGYELGTRDISFSLLPAILEMQRHADKNSSVFFLGGYLRVLFERNQAQWEEQADILANDEILRNWLPELTFRSALTDRAALRLLKLAEENAINIGHFRLFGAGRAIQKLSEVVFQGWIVALLSNSHPYATSIALDLYYIYYVEQESSQVLPAQLTQLLLTLSSWLIPVESVKIEQMDYYRWTEVGKAFARIYPERSLFLANWMLEYFGATGTILDSFSGTLTVLNEIAEQHPQDVWKLIISRLGPPTDTRAFYIQHWLRGDDDSLGNKAVGMLNVFPLEIIWQWVNEDVEQRAWYLASFTPKALFKHKEQTCIAREVLVHYGDREDVRSAFSANYFSGMWWGPESKHYEKVKQELLDSKKEEENKNVKRWIDGYVEELDKYIQQAKLREERDNF